MTILPRDKIRLTNFLREKCEKNTPTFWDGKAIIPFGSFDLVVTEKDDPIWKWEGQIHYQEEMVYVIKGNSFGYDFLNGMINAVEEVGYSYLEEWGEKVFEIIEYIENKQGVSFTSSSDTSHEEFSSVQKYSWVSGDWPEIKARVQIVTTEFSEPTITLDSIYIENKYVFSISLEDETYKDVVDNFFDELKKAQQ